MEFTISMADLMREIAAGCLGDGKEDDDSGAGECAGDGAREPWAPGGDGHGGRILCGCPAQMRKAGTGSGPGRLLEWVKLPPMGEVCAKIGTSPLASMIALAE